jgi:hypothetical protein
VNRKKLGIGELNFAPGFVDHGEVPDQRVTTKEMTAEDEKAVVRNHGIETDASSKQRLEFFGIVIWRIANRQILEPWAYQESPRSIRG